MMPHSLYFHVPFCWRRCHYCDFDTFAGRESLIPRYVDAVQAEIRSCQAAGGLPVQTIYFGGGTPSLLSPGQIRGILTTCGAVFDLQPGIEVSLEANPGTLSPDYLGAVRSRGINRLSLGVQSARPQELELLGRQHGYPDVTRAVAWARQAGFENLSLDLIFGLPGQTLAQWAGSLALTLGLWPEHFSLYALTIEPGTPLQRWVSRGLLPSPDPDLAADMYELAAEALARAGYVQYEISNWARAAEKERAANAQPAAQNDPLPPTAGRESPFECRHNLQYWRNLPYLGFGAGAHGFAGGQRTANVLMPEEYIQRLEAESAGRADSFPRTPATLEMIPVTRQAEMGETMMMGLRLVREGVSDAAFRSRFGCSMREVFGQEIGKLENWGLVEWLEDTLRLTARGRLLGNQVFLEFV